MFKDTVDKFESILEQGCVYTFSNGQVKLANLRYTSVKNDYGLVFDIHSKIEKVADDESIQSVSYNFKNMNEQNYRELIRTGADSKNLSLSGRNLFNATTYDNFNIQKPGRAFYLKVRYFISKS